MVSSNLGCQYDDQQHCLTREIVADMSQRLECRMFFHDETDSTSTVAKNIIRGDVDVPFFVIANTQTSGYGQYGNKWDSEHCGNLYVSYASDGSCCRENQQMYVKFLALKICSYLREKFLINAMVKWPNDVFSSVGKIGGLLSESFSYKNRTFFVTGVGINILHAPDVCCRYYKAGSIADAARSQVRFVDVVFDILSLILQTSRESQKNIFDNMSSLWEKYDMLRGKDMTIESGGKMFHGVGCGIGKSGELIVKLADGTVARFYSGNAKISAFIN